MVVTRASSPITDVAPTRAGAGAGPTGGCVEAARPFYEGTLGLGVAMAQDGMLVFASTTTPTTRLIVAWRCPTAVDPHVCDVDVSLEVDDVDAAHALAVQQGSEVLYPLTDEAWGIRRFLVRDPTGARVDIAGHSAVAGHRGPAGPRSLDRRAPAGAAAGECDARRE